MHFGRHRLSAPAACPLRLLEALCMHISKACTRLVTLWWCGQPSLTLTCRRRLLCRSPRTSSCTLSCSPRGCRSPKQQAGA